MKCRFVLVAFLKLIKQNSNSAIKSRILQFYIIPIVNASNQLSLDSVTVTEVSLSTRWASLNITATLDLRVLCRASIRNIPCYWCLPLI
jgi:hypothetical protein